MSKIDNIDPMERIVHQAFHNIADKHGIDVDLVAEIISEFDDIMGKSLESKIVIEEN